MICIIFIIILVVYYVNVILEIGATKYCNSPIVTKIDLLFALIPFQIWVKQLVYNIKKLD
jgi:hypothetical protein